jgi:cobalamin biosynthesis Mg chelatase CobN
MLGMRHHPARTSGRPAFALLSVLALLAMACFPVASQAEESVNPVYETEVPSPTGPKKTPQSKNDSGAKSSQTGGATAPGGAGESSESGSGSSEEASGGAVRGSGGDGGTGQGSPGDGSKGEANQAGNQQPQGSQQGEQARAATSSDDSSSPLVPILIAIAVLAAISIGAILYRQRRQRTGTPVAPKAS